MRSDTDAYNEEELTKVPTCESERLLGEVHENGRDDCKQVM